MRLVVTRRIKPLRFGGIIIPLLSIIIGIVIASIALLVLARVPPTLVYTIIAQSFVSPQLLRPFVLLTILGVALIISFSAAVWNIGAEGQIIWGMIATGYIGLFVAAHSMYIKPSELPTYENMPGVMILDRSPIHPVVSVLNVSPAVGGALMILAALVFGAIWAFIAGTLRAVLEIDEVASTLIMNYIAYYSFNYLVTGPMRGLSVQARNFGRTDALHEALRFQRLPIAGTTVTWQEVATMVVVFVLAWVLLKYTTYGLRLRILGSNPNALRAAGVSVRKYIIAALTISGAIAGVVGALIFAANLFALNKIDNVVSPPTQSMGYTAILVSWLAMLDLKGIPISAYIVAGLMQTGNSLQAALGSVSTAGAMISGAAITHVLVGFVLLTYTVLRVFTEYSIKVVRGGR